MSVSECRRATELKRTSKAQEAGDKRRHGAARIHSIMPTLAHDTSQTSSRYFAGHSAQKYLGFSGPTRGISAKVNEARLATRHRHMQSVSSSF